MAYIVNVKDRLFSDICTNNKILLFLEKSIEVARKLDIGCYEKLILNDTIFSIPQNTLLKSSLECIFESHKEYIDIHIIINGVENIELLDIKEVSTPYEENIENDYFLYKSDEDTKKVILDQDRIGIFLFEDIHKVGIKSSYVENNVVKVVLKIKKNVFEKEFIYE